MEFGYTVEEEKFRERLARFLDEHLTEEIARASRKKRCSVTGSLVQDSERNFRATWRPSLVSSAL